MDRRMDEENKTGHRDRLRERFLRGEESALTDEKLLELLLTYAIPQKDVRPLALEG
jgi:DNA repair protein RadC